MNVPEAEERPCVPPLGSWPLTDLGSLAGWAAVSLVLVLHSCELGWGASQGGLEKRLPWP